MIGSSSTFVRAAALSAVLQCALYSFCQAADEARTSAYVVTDGERAVLSELKEAIALRDPQRISNRVIYPIKLCVGDRERRVRNAAEFERNFDRIMNRDVRSAVTAQSPDDLFKNWQGVMIGQGQVWIGSYPAFHRRNPYPEAMFYIKTINNQSLVKGPVCASDK
jgi:hypothetical protein